MAETTARHRGNDGWGMGDDPYTPGPDRASAESSPGRLFLGTCAWSFEDWRGGFYPEGLPAGNQLAHYAQHLPAVEIDSTFYAVPRPGTVERWAEVTPENFRFTAKLPKLITHDARLRGEEAGRVLAAFLGAVARPLGPKLGAVLVQLPPSFAPTPADREALDEFLALLPADRVPFAVEFRHPGWWRGDPADLAARLAEHGVTLAWNDLSGVDAMASANVTAGFPPPATPLVYLRLMGDQETKFDGAGERRFRYDGTSAWPRDAALDGWAARVRAALADARVRHVFVLANNHFEGFSPRTCQRLGERLGMEVKLPEVRREPEQLGLF